MEEVFCYLFGKIFLRKFYLRKKILLKAFFVEINLRNKKKWLISCSYNPKKTSLSNHIVAFSKNLDLFTTKYERLIFLGDFNAEMEDLSNCPGLFQNSCVTETGLLDFHKMIVRVMKTSYQKIESRVVNFGDYKVSPVKCLENWKVKRKIIGKLLQKLEQIYKCNNKAFWEIVKPMLPKKIKSNKCLKMIKSLELKRELQNS